MISRRHYLGGIVAASALLKARASSALGMNARGGKTGYTPVVTPNGSTLPFTMNGGVKEFRLTAEPVVREAPPSPRRSGAMCRDSQGRGFGRGSK